jgi:hypothetical protein
VTNRLTNTGSSDTTVRRSAYSAAAGFVVVVTISCYTVCVLLILILFIQQEVVPLVGRVRVCLGMARECGRKIVVLVVHLLMTIVLVVLLLPTSAVSVARPLDVIVIESRVVFGIAGVLLLVFCAVDEGTPTASLTAAASLACSGGQVGRGLCFEDPGVDGALRRGVAHPQRYVRRHQRSRHAQTATATSPWLSSGGAGSARLRDGVVHEHSVGPRATLLVLQHRVSRVELPEARRLRPQCPKRR